MTLVDNRNCTDPYINLAIEEYLIRNADCSKQNLLLLYVNEPCIVLGKNQSIYKEVNFEYLRNGKLKLCRRISGGGTVYHDKGNLSFSFIQQFAENKINNYKLFNQPVVDALRKMGVDAEMDERNNILCGGKKISGSAQFTNRKNIISHGTLLYDADLTTLRACLKDNDFPVESRAVSSVKSPVMNLKEVVSEVTTVEQLKTYLQSALKTNDKLEFTAEQWAAIETEAEKKFCSFEWVYGRSPLTTITKGEVVVEVENGIILSIRNPQSQIQNLVGLKYEYNMLKHVLSTEELSVVF